MNWFGKKKPANASTTTKPSSRTDPTTTILTLRESLDTQEKR